MTKLYGVITTIQQPTADVQALAECRDISKLIIIGDKKGPTSFDLEGACFYDLPSQMTLPYELAVRLPIGCYARKNIGYLIAISEDAPCIYETDDDNAPLPHWQKREQYTEAVDVETKGWVNAYRYFSDENIWPRGLPLNEIKKLSVDGLAKAHVSVSCAPIQQGLANGSPDVDAIWRLVLDHEFTFKDVTSIRLNPGAWCPFNSQSTWWWPEAYPLMYLPSFCSFRMTDIWRSFIAQRCLWELGHGVIFHAAEVFQQRNEHDLMRDFTEEIDGYTGNSRFADVLTELRLKKGKDALTGNLRACYTALIEAGFFPAKEMDLLNTWIGDLESIRSRHEK